MRVRRFLSVVLCWGCIVVLPYSAALARGDDTTFKRIPLQFVAALGDPTASGGTGAEAWGVWRHDPGPRGVPLGKYGDLVAAAGVAPAGWTFDPGAWWLEENGLIMEAPTFPLPPGRYVVTGGRDTSSILTIHPPNDSGTAQWDLSGGATLHDVTHLDCRSARYTPALQGGTCVPTSAPRDVFRLRPGAAMPDVPNCRKQDYVVLFIIGVIGDTSSAALE